MKRNRCSRRNFLRSGVSTLAAAPFLAIPNFSRAAETPVRATQTGKVAIVSCRTYGPAVRKALDEAFDMLGGIGSLVRNKTVTIKLNGKEVVKWTQPADWNGGREGAGRMLGHGTIALQGHDPNSTVYYKNIRIKPLP